MIKGSFVAVDVETANANMSSICQIGIASFKGGKLAGQWVSLVDPEDYFDGINVSIHGIDERKVRGAPRFPQLYKTLIEKFGREVVVSHTHFDRASLIRATEKYRLPCLDCLWLDSARVVRRTWSQFSYAGYGLSNICSELGIEFQHHDALEDARAAGEIFIHAMETTGLDVEQWLSRVRKPINLDETGRPIGIAQEGNREGFLAGEEIVFTGALSMPRKEAAALAASAGCDVSQVVRKTTTLLVVGDQDVSKLAGHAKSTKHRKAEEMIGCGQQIRILRESDFQLLLRDPESA